MDWSFALSDLVCSVCGQPALDAPQGLEIEPNTYGEYKELGNVKWIVWVYCRPCNAWTQHPVLEE